MIRVGKNHPQGKYLYSYLYWQDASIVLRERNYHDWEFASQFQVYYSASSSGYPNLCSRHHYFANIPSICHAIDENEDVCDWKLGSKIEIDVLTAYSGLRKWCERYTKRSVSDLQKDPSLANLELIEDWIKQEFKHSMADKNIEMICNLRNIRRGFEESVLKKLMQAYDQVRLKCGSNLSENTNYCDIQNEGQYNHFTDLRRYDQLDAIISGLHHLHQYDDGVYFGLESLIHLLMGMPQDSSDKIEWMKKTIALCSAEHPVAKSLLQGAYLGYIVERPLPHSPIGNTILKFPRSTDTILKPRIIQSLRQYESTFLGISLSVSSLGWQQADQATGACATQALWSALQGRIYNHLTTPSSPVLTILANKFHAAGQRTFPSRGLGYHNLAEAIRRQDGLAPLVIDGDLSGVRNGVFSRKAFNSICASLLYGGFPIMLFGMREGHDDRHVICLTGFSSGGFKELPGGDVSCTSSDSNVATYYGHDVSIGINVRFKIVPVDITINKKQSIKETQYIALEYSDSAAEITRLKFLEMCNIPNKTSEKLTDDDIAKIKDLKRTDKNIREISNKLIHLKEFDPGTVNHFEPNNIVIALPRQMRSNPKLFLDSIENKLSLILISLELFNMPCIDGTEQKLWPYENEYHCLTYSIRYISLNGYLKSSLKRRLPPNPTLLSKVRRNVLEKVRHMPDYISILRVGMLFKDDNNKKGSPIDHPLMDLIYDTTETDKHTSVFATVKYLKVATSIINVCQKSVETIVKEYQKLGKKSDGIFTNVTPDIISNMKDFGTEIDAYCEDYGNPFPSSVRNST